MSEKVRYVYTYLALVKKEFIIYGNMNGIGKYYWKMKYSIFHLYVNMKQSAS